MSSGALGFLGSAGALTTGDLGYLLNLVPNGAINALLNQTKDLAPVLEVKTVNGISTVSDPTPGFIGATTAPSDFGSTGISAIRMADGGFVDNSSVTGALTYLQANGKLAGFRDTLFTFSTPGDTGDAALVKINPAYANLGVQADYLFTGSVNTGTVINLSHTDTAIFDSSKTKGLDAPVWSHQGNAGFNIALYVVDVRTANGNSWGLQGGVQGTLDVWKITTTAESLPVLNGQPFSQYSTLFNDVVSSLQFQNHGHSGVYWLEKTLGLIGVPPVAAHAVA